MELGHAIQSRKYVPCTSPWELALLIYRKLSKLQFRIARDCLSSHAAQKLEVHMDGRIIDGAPQHRMEACTRKILCHFE